MVDVRIIDTSATTGTSALHGMSPVVKLVAFGAVLAAVVVQDNVLVVASVALVVAAVVLAMRLPWRHVFALAAYPAVFAMVFALAAAPDFWTGALIVSKAVTAALAAVVLVFTTPYPQLFAPLQAVTPQLVGDAMLMTYRSLFLMAEKFTQLLRAVRLRSGLSSGQPLRAARATATALGSLVLYAFDLSQREYDIMRLRGYEGRLRVSRRRVRRPLAHTVLLAGAFFVLAVAALWAAFPVVLDPYSWLPLAAAVLVFAAIVSWRSIRS